MGHPFRCITNNPMLMDRGFTDLEFYETDVLELFREVLKKVTSGYRLLSHPLTGSIRPDITPYKTVLLSGTAGSVDMESVTLIEKAIRYAEDLYRMREVPVYRKWGKAALEDFQCIDLSIVERALEVEEMGK